MSTPETVGATGSVSLVIDNVVVGQVPITDVAASAVTQVLILQQSAAGVQNGTQLAPLRPRGRFDGGGRLRSLVQLVQPTPTGMRRAHRTRRATRTRASSGAAAPRIFFFYDYESGSSETVTASYDGFSPSVVVHGQGGSVGRPRTWPARSESRRGAGAAARHGRRSGRSSSPASPSRSDGGVLVWYSRWHVRDHAAGPRACACLACLSPRLRARPRGARPRVRRNHAPPFDRHAPPGRHDPLSRRRRLARRPRPRDPLGLARSEGARRFRVLLPRGHGADPPGSTVTSRRSSRSSTRSRFIPCLGTTR